MSTPTWTDKFDRPDGQIGSNYLVPCGSVFLFDEAVLPVEVEEINGSEVLQASLQRTQVFYNADTLDGPDQVLRAVWGHDNVVPAGVDTPPSFTILARASKDPLVVDLTPPEESPDCYDQFYGLRVTCPLDGSNPVLKLVKKTPLRRAPNLSAASTSESDDAQVLASVTLAASALHVDPAWDGTGNAPYRGFWQDMRLRIRHGNDQVVLEAFLNDRYLNTPILTYTDRADPLWSIVGLPGFEFLSAVLSAQPAGASPYAQSAEALMRCTLFSAQTLKVFRRPVQVQPTNQFTYDRVVDRVIQLVEKNGDATYTATNSGATKRQIYLGFVMEAEAEIIRREGYYHWLQRSGQINLADQVGVYELPGDVGEVLQIRPGNFVGQPFRELTQFEFHQLLAGRGSTGGKPGIYHVLEESVNNRQRIELYPVPLVQAIAVNSQTDDTPWIAVDYYARQMVPDNPAMQIPFVPQQDIDVLIYGATAAALLLDTDAKNTEQMTIRYEMKLKDLRRKNNRKSSTRQTVMRCASDIYDDNPNNQVPLLRATQLGNFIL
jgi:hypothetical protein